MIRIFKQCKHHYKYFKSEECSFLSRWLDIRKIYARDIYYVCEKCGKQIVLQNDIIEIMKKKWYEEYTKKRIQYKLTVEMKECLVPEEYVRLKLQKYYNGKNMSFEHLPTYEPYYGFMRYQYINL